MGRGLSELQKCVLYLAFKNHRSVERSEERMVSSEHGADVTYSEVLCCYYGWEPQKRRIQSRYREWFRGKLVGGNERNATRAAVSRAIQRLGARGFVVPLRGRHWAGANLTDEGSRIAENVSVKQRESCPLINRYNGKQ